MAESWAFCSRYSGAPAFVTRLEDRDGFVGRNYFRDRAREIDAKLTSGEPGGGILKSVDVLESDRFHPEQLAPLVRDVWEHTTALAFVANPTEWSPWAKLFAPLFRWLGSAMQQINVPQNPGRPQEIESFVSLMDLDRDGTTDYRIWLRTAGANVYYVAAVFTHSCDGPRGRQSYLDVVLPLPGSNAAIVFEPSNLPGGGLCVSTRAPGSYDAGSYLILPGRSRYSMAPFFGLDEEIRITPNHDGTLRAVHETTWLGFRSFTIEYTLRRKATIRRSA